MDRERDDWGLGDGVVGSGSDESRGGEDEKPGVDGGSVECARKWVRDWNKTACKNLRGQPSTVNRLCDPGQMRYGLFSTPARCDIECDLNIKSHLVASHTLGDIFFVCLSLNSAVWR